MTILKGELQTDNGDLLYPHTSSTVVFGPDGIPVSKQIDVLNDSFGIGGMVTVTQDADDLPQGNCVGNNLKNAPIQSGWLEYNTSVWFRGATEYKTQLAKDLVGNQWYRVRNAGVWTVWEDKISVLAIDRGYVKTPTKGGNPNQFIENGKYTYIADATSSLPAGTWLIDVISELNENTVIQEAKCTYGSSYGKKFIRYMQFGNWADWQQIATTSKIEILQSDLKNGWKVTPNNSIYISRNGNYVSFNGFIFDGVRSPSTLIFSIPQNFAPSSIRDILVQADAISQIASRIIVHPDGSVILYNCNNTTGNLIMSGGYSI